MTSVCIMQLLIFGHRSLENHGIPSVFQPDAAKLHRRWTIKRSMKQIVLVVAACLAVVSPAPAQDNSHDRLSLAQLRSAYGAADGKYMSIDGIDVYYRDEGQGSPILLLHGSVSTSATWDGVAKILSRKWRVIRYDIPPQGLSGPVSDAIAARLQPADIAIGLLTQLKIPRATLIGVSSGGTLGIALAAKRPDLVQRLILSNTPADPVPSTGLPTSPALAAEQKIAQETHFQRQAFWDAFLDFFAGVPSRYGPEIRRQYYDMNRRLPEPNVLSMVARVADHAKAVQAMNAVSVPTLLIWGARDKLLPPAAAAILAGYLTHAQVSTIMLPDVGHFPPIEVPSRFAQIVEAYIDGATP